MIQAFGMLDRLDSPELELSVASKGTQESKSCFDKRMLVYNNHKLIVYWDILNAAVVLFSLILVPYTLAFEKQRNRA